jgi:hypothetical protein
VELDRDWDVFFLLLVGFVARWCVAAADGEPVAEDEDVVADRNDFFFGRGSTGIGSKPKLTDTRCYERG